MSFISNERCCDGWLHHQTANPNVLDYARSAQDFERLVQAGAKVERDSIDSYVRVLGGVDANTILKLKEQGAEIDYKTHDMTILMRLAKENRAKELKTVLKAGADPHIGRGTLYWGNVYALDHALREDAKDCAAVLVLHGASFQEENVNRVRKIALDLLKSPSHLRFREVHGMLPPSLSRLAALKEACK